MEKIEVTITDKNTAKEINPYKSEIERKYDRGGRPSIELLDLYQKKESELRTFEIENIRGFTPAYIRKKAPKLIAAAVGSKHMAEVLPSGKIRIL